MLAACVVFIIGKLTAIVRYSFRSAVGVVFINMRVISALLTVDESVRIVVVFGEGLVQRSERDIIKICRTVRLICVLANDLYFMN